MELLNGLLAITSSMTLIGFVFLGVVAGILVGATPGMSIAAFVALMLPVTLYMDPLSALVFLYVFGKAGRYGGSIAAILFNTPGTVAAAGTMQDGYPLTMQGRARSALRVSAVSSAAGDFIGDMFLIFGAIAVASFTEKFGPAEFFAIFLMAFVVIGSVVSDSVSKGLVAAAAGILLSLVGTDPITGMGRMDFGSLDLQRGFGLIPVLVGVFVFAELFDQALNVRLKRSDIKVLKPKDRNPPDPGISREEWGYIAPVVVRSSVLGSIIGILPGLGSAVACFAAYGEEKRRAKRPELWGKGALEGVAAPEAANNAVSGPSMIPLLTLGVPGSTIAALLMGVFMIHGIQIGPLIFVTSSDLVYSLFAAGLLGILGYGVIGFFFAPLIGRAISHIDQQVIYPLIFVTTFIAAYTVSSNLVDVIVMTVFGVVGLVMKRFNYPAPAFIIAFVLGRGAEETLRQTVLLDDSGLLTFLDRPVAMSFIGIGLAVMLWRGWQGLRNSDGNKKEEKLGWGEIVVSLVLVVLCIAFIQQISYTRIDEDGPINSRTMPYFLTGCVLLFSLFRLVKMFRTIHRPSFSLEADTKLLLKLVFVLSSLMLFYVWACGFIGYSIATTMTLAGVFLTFDLKTPWKIAALSLVTALIAHLIFVEAMGVFFPTPVLNLF